MATQQNLILYLQGDEEILMIHGKPHRYPFGQTLLDLLDVNMEQHIDLFQEIKESITAFAKTTSASDAMRTRKLLGKAAGIHIYLELFRQRWSSWLDEARDKGGAPGFSYKDILGIPTDLMNDQDCIKRLFHEVLDVLSPQFRSVQTKMVNFYESDRDFAAVFPFEEMPIRMGKVDDNTFVEVLHPQYVSQVVEFFVRRFIAREQAVKVCKHCGRYFAVMSHANAEYCDRMYRDTGRTCRDIGAIQMYKSKIKNDPVMKLYNRAYKKHYAWIRYGKFSREEFYAWSKEAQAMRDRCLSNEISIEEFQGWLDD